MGSYPAIRKEGVTVKKILEQIFYSFIVMVFGLVFAFVLVAVASSSGSDNSLNVIMFLTIYLIWIVSFFGIRIIYLLKSQNRTLDEKDDKEPF